MKKVIPIVALSILLGMGVDGGRTAKADVVIDVTETAIFEAYFSTFAGYTAGQLGVRHRDFGGMNNYSAMRIDLSSVDAYLAAHSGSYVASVTLSVALMLTEPNPGPGKDYWFEYNPGDWADNWNPRAITDGGQFPMGPAPVNFPDVRTATIHVDGSDQPGQVYSMTNDLLRDMVANDTNRVLSLWFASQENSEGAAGWFNRYFNNVQLIVSFAGETAAVPEPASVIQSAIGLGLAAVGVAARRRALR